MDARILITGATGLVGLPCVRHLAARGFVVHGTGNRSSRSSIDGVHLSKMNLLDFDAITPLLREVQPTHLLHLAWITTPQVYWTSPLNYQWVDASVHLLREFTRLGGHRAVLIGSCAEYDWSCAGHCHETNTPLRPASIYGQCKHELRMETEAFAKHAGISLGWARLFHLYGVGEHPSRLVPSVIHSLLLGEPAICNDGAFVRDFLNSDEAGSALAAFLMSDARGAMNIGSGQGVSIRHVVETIADLIGKRELLQFEARPARVGDPPQLTANTERLSNELSWTPRIGLRDGLNDVIQKWRKRLAA